MFKFIKLFKNKNLNFFWFYIYMQYTKLKYALLNKNQKNNISNKLIFVNFIKTKFLKTINLNINNKKFKNLINKKKILFLLFKLIKNISFNKIKLNSKLNSNKKIYSLINFVFINKLLINKSSN
jgi:hypothetical protein